MSGSRLNKTSDHAYNYTTPVVLYDWGGKNYCDELELLYKSPQVKNEEWKSFDINIKPTDNLKYLTIHAFFADGKHPYNGHILLDNLSSIVEKECEE